MIAERIDLQSFRDLVNASMSEAKLQALVRRFARLTGWEYQYHTYDSRRSDEGFPDLVLGRESVILFVELKTQKGKLSPEQEWWQSFLVRMEDASRGAIRYRCWRPADFDLMVATLAEGMEDRIRII